METTRIRLKVTSSNERCRRPKDNPFKLATGNAIDALLLEQQAFGARPAKAAHIKEKLDSGSFGSVYLAEEYVAGQTREVAIKRSTNPASDQETGGLAYEHAVTRRILAAKNRLAAQHQLSEQTLSTLDELVLSEKYFTANSAKVFTLNDELHACYGKEAFLVEEAVPGVNIDHASTACKENALFDQHGAPKSPARSVEVLQHLANQLDALAQLGFGHNDLKEANVMLDEKGVPHIVDFGSAAAFGEENGSGSGNASPDIFIDHTTRPDNDIYMLGTMMLTVLFGRSPNRGDSVRFCYDDQNSVSSVEDLFWMRGFRASPWRVFCASKNQSAREQEQALRDLFNKCNQKLPENNRYDQLVLDDLIRLNARMCRITPYVCTPRPSAALCLMQFSTILAYLELSPLIEADLADMTIISNKYQALFEKALAERNAVLVSSLFGQTPFGLADNCLNKLFTTLGANLNELQAALPENTKHKAQQLLAEWKDKQLRLVKEALRGPKKEKWETLINQTDLISEALKYADEAGLTKNEQNQLLLIQRLDTDAFNAMREIKESVTNFQNVIHTPSSSEKAVGDVLYRFWQINHKYQPGQLLSLVNEFLTQRETESLDQTSPLKFLALDQPLEYKKSADDESIASITDPKEQLGVLFTAINNNAANFEQAFVEAIADNDLEWLNDWYKKDVMLELIDKNGGDGKLTYIDGVCRLINDLKDMELTTSNREFLTTLYQLLLEQEPLYFPDNRRLATFLSEKYPASFGLINSAGLVAAPEQPPVPAQIHAMPSWYSDAVPLVTEEQTPPVEPENSSEISIKV